MGADGQFDGAEVSNVALREDARQDEIDAARQLLEQAMRPCDVEVVSRCMGELLLLTKRRDPGDDAKLINRAYGRRLMEYPEDVVKAACSAWANRETFWPSWAELKAEADRRMRGRLKLRVALTRFR